MSCIIHPTALVAKGAELGSEVTVGPYSIIGEWVKIGDRTRIGPHVVIEGHTTLGSDNTIFQFASIGAAPQDLKFRGEPSQLLIGDRNTVREFVTLQPGTKHGTMKTVIGDENLFMANSHVAHDCRVGNKNVFSNSVALAGHVTLENRIILGGMAGIHQFCRVGELAIIGAGSMVAHDIPPYCIGQGDRCHLRGINLIGLKRAGYSEGEIKEIRQVYRALFSRLGRLEQKINTLSSDLRERPHIKKLLEFLSDSQRGISTPLKHNIDQESDLAAPGISVNE